MSFTFAYDDNEGDNDDDCDDDEDDDDDVKYDDDNDVDAFYDRVRSNGAELNRYMYIFVVLH